MDEYECPTDPLDPLNWKLVLDGVHDLEPTTALPKWGFDSVPMLIGQSQ